ncbi:MAG: methyltransferase domain-containing protein [bacterium]|nr:methyltransferase domain-containing protein [bacterium]
MHSTIRPKSDRPARSPVRLQPVIAECPACGHHVASPFFTGGEKPLATLGWPHSGKEALLMKRLPLNFVSCVECTHVFNADFNYENIPYSEMPDLTLNQGENWLEFCRKMQNRIIQMLPEQPTVVEIGYGDGGFLNDLARLRPEGRYIGFDPNGVAQNNNKVELLITLFQPDVHLGEIMPDLIISRHVLEHMANPLAFLQGLQFSATCLGMNLIAYFEVPCIDRALTSRRTVDFYYERNSLFTSRSFSRMLSRSGVLAEDVGVGYGGEVIYGFLRLGDAANQLQNARIASNFEQAAHESELAIGVQMEELYASGVRVAIWGGTGRSAAFINRYVVDAERFPIVVDSDPDKIGTFVPGMGQQILPPEALLENPVDVVIIPPQWRARDIVTQIQSLGIKVSRILIEHKGQLVEFDGQY